MATTYRYEGESVPYVGPTGGKSSGNVQVVRSGTSGMIGIWEDDVAAAATGTLAVTGVHELTSDTGTAYAVGDILYWTGTTLTKTSTGNTRAGVCWAAKVSGGTTALVNIGR